MSTQPTQGAPKKKKKKVGRSLFALFFWVNFFVDSWGKKRPRRVPTADRRPPTAGRRPGGDPGDRLFPVFAWFLVLGFRFSFLCMAFFGFWRFSSSELGARSEVELPAHVGNGGLLHKKIVNRAACAVEAPFLRHGTFLLLNPLLWAFFKGEFKNTKDIWAQKVCVSVCVCVLLLPFARG
jgi:hypothetical protein